MRFQWFFSGAIWIDDITYEHDVIVPTRRTIEALEHDETGTNAILLFRSLYPFGLTCPHLLRGLKGSALIFIGECFAHALLSRVNFNVAPNFGLAGQDITLRFVLFGEGIVDGHAHVARYELNAARSACSRAAGVVDEDAGLVSCI